MSTLSDNPFAGYINLARVFEIAYYGGHSVAIVFDDDQLLLPDKDRKRLERKFHDHEVRLTTPEDADIVVEITRPDFNQLLNGRQEETVMDILKRVSALPNRMEQIKNRHKNTPKIDLDKSSESLLKTAYERCGFFYSDLVSILNVAETISVMDNSATVLTQHIAEAIHYRTCEKIKRTKDAL